MISKNGRNSILSYRYTDRLVVAQAATLEVAPGDRLQLKFSGKSKEGTALTNGELVTAGALLPSGELIVIAEGGSKKTLLPSQRLFNHGYAITSYASQGKTADIVLFSDSGVSAATSENQWYVAITRGRKRALVFTSDKAKLRSNVIKSGDRELAIDAKAGAPEVTHGQVIQTPAWLAQAWANIRRVQSGQSVQAHQQSQNKGIRL